jgi:glycosyltransferase involved in cell wall biosynthesis
MERLKTLIILSPGFPDNEEDTTCLPSQQVLVRTLSEQFPKLQILVLAFQYPYESRRYLWNEVHVKSLGGRNPGKLKRLGVWIGVWRELKNILRNGKDGIGVLSFWLGECALVGSAFSRFYHLPHYTWVLGQDAKKGNKYYRLIRPPANELIAVSDFIADEFERNYFLRPAHIIPVGIDTSAFPPLRPVRDIDILGAGSLIPLKRYDVFIDVIGELSQEFPFIKAVICGSGPQRDTLQRKIEDRGLGDRVELWGGVSHGEVLQLMQRTRIFLHPSDYEGFAAVFAEALYAGAHIVSYCKPVKGVVEHWHIVNSKENLLKQMRVLLREPALADNRVLHYSGRQMTIDLMRILSGEVMAKSGEFIRD